MKTIETMATNGYSKAKTPRTLGSSRLTVDHYVKEDQWSPSAKRDQGRLNGLEDSLRERFLRHDGNADVVRQDVWLDYGVEIGLHSVERSVAPFRRGAG